VPVACTTHLAGDTSQSRYASFVNQEAGIIQGQGKTVMG